MSRVVVKIGTSSITDDEGDVNRGTIAKLCREVAALRASGSDVVIVTSGAIAAGLPELGLGGANRPSDAVTLQAVATVGQVALMEVYRAELASHGLVSGQVLLTPHDFIVRAQYLHARQTLTCLLELGVVPVVNENDSVATEELRFGDNDRLAAAVGATVGADLVILLSDIDALYDADPRTAANAQPIVEVQVIDDTIRAMAGAAGSSIGTGGMASKIAAAELAVGAGIPLIVASGQDGHVLKRLLNGEIIGTRFAASTTVGRRRHWIGFLSKVKGTVTIDTGCVSALRERGSSLLAAGITSVEGAFERGDSLRIVDELGEEVARGLSGYASSDLVRICGCRSSEVLRVLDVDAADPVVHRDDLLLTPMN